MELPVLVPIEYRDELVALVSRQRVHIVSPWLLDLPAGDPDLRFVAFMCACCGEVLNGRIPGPFTSEFGERWARSALISPHDLVSFAEPRMARRRVSSTCPLISSARRGASPATRRRARAERPGLWSRRPRVRVPSLTPQLLAANERFRDKV
jgi:hypothetical protein